MKTTIIKAMEANENIAKETRLVKAFELVCVDADAERNACGVRLFDMCGVDSKEAILFECFARRAAQEAEKLRKAKAKAAQANAARDAAVSDMNKITSDAESAKDDEKEITLARERAHVAQEAAQAAQEAAKAANGADKATKEKAAQEAAKAAQEAAQAARRLTLQNVRFIVSEEAYKAAQEKTKKAIERADAAQEALESAQNALSTINTFMEENAEAFADAEKITYALKPVNAERVNIITDFFTGGRFDRFAQVVSCANAFNIAADAMNAAKEHADALTAHEKGSKDVNDKTRAASARKAAEEAATISKRAYLVLKDALTICGDAYGVKFNGTEARRIADAVRALGIKYDSGVWSTKAADARALGNLFRNLSLVKISGGKIC